MDTQPLLDWLLSFLESQGIGTFLILFGVWFLDRRLWPLVRDVIVATWAETRKAETAYLGRGVAALERIATSAEGGKLHIRPPEQ